MDTAADKNMRKIVDLHFGNYDRVWTLYNVISIEFEILPKIDSFEAFSEFLLTGCGFFVNIRYADSLRGSAAEEFRRILLLFDRLRKERGSDFLDYCLLPREAVTLDFSCCQSECEVYSVMRREMEWEDWYGENLDALWDILTGLPYKGDDFFIIRPREYTGLPYEMNLRMTKQVSQICEIFREAQETYGDLTVEVQYKENGK